MKKIIILLWLVSVVSFVAKAQKEANLWYFGEKAGITFQSGKPESITDGVIFTDEGCATICNKAGELLFYTDGKPVWNKKHELMSNGQGLISVFLITN